MKDNYTYPVLLEPSEDGMTDLFFPGFDGVTCIHRGEDPIRAAQDYLAMEIKSYEDDGRPLPAENLPVEVSEGQKLIYVNLWMPYHRSKVKETYIKKTLTIPLWLDMLARENNINFSATLAEGLKRKLHLGEDITDAEKTALYKHSGD